MWDISTIFDLIKTLFLFVFVVVLMIITIRTLAKYQNKLSGNKNIKVLERASLSQNTTLNIVKIGKSLYLMSSSSTGVTILKQLPEEEIDENAYTMKGVGDIGLDSILKNGKNYAKSFKGKVKNEKKSSK